MRVFTLVTCSRFSRYVTSLRTVRCRFAVSRDKYVCTVWTTLQQAAHAISNVFNGHSSVTVVSTRVSKCSASHQSMSLQSSRRTLWTCAFAHNILAKLSVLWMKSLPAVLFILSCYGLPLIYNCHIASCVLAFYRMYADKCDHVNKSSSIWFAFVYH